MCIWCASAFNSMEIFLHMGGNNGWAPVERVLAVILNATKAFPNGWEYCSLQTVQRHDQHWSTSDSHLLFRFPTAPAIGKRSFLVDSTACNFMERALTWLPRWYFCTSAWRTRLTDKAESSRKSTYQGPASIRQFVPHKQNMGIPG